MDLLSLSGAGGGTSLSGGDAVLYPSSPCGVASSHGGVSAAENTPADAELVVEVFAGKKLSACGCTPAANFSLLFVVCAEKLSDEDGDASRLTSSVAAEARVMGGILLLLLPPPVALLPPRGALLPPPPPAVLPDGAEDVGVVVPEAAGDLPVRRASSSAFKRPRICPSGARRRISINLTNPISS
jgi:hypothetical protein